MPHVPSSKQSMRVTLFAVFIGIAALLFMVGLVRTLVADYTVRKEIQSLEREKTQLEQNKLTLLNRFQDIKSNAFVEQEARLKFGLQKPGESVIILNNAGESARESASSTAEGAAADSVSNAHVWWNYFFN